MAKKNKRKGSFRRAKTPEARERQNRAISRNYAEKDAKRKKTQKNVGEVNNQSAQIKQVPSKKSNIKEPGDVDVLIKTHKDNKGGHYHVILENIDDKHVSVGLTTDPKKGKNSTNYKLEKSPFLDGQVSYLRRQGTVDDYSAYTGALTGIMTSKDYGQAKIYGERAKQKYLDRKNKR